MGCPDTNIISLCVCEGVSTSQLCVHKDLESKHKDESSSGCGSSIYLEEGKRPMMEEEE